MAEQEITSLKALAQYLIDDIRKTVQEPVMFDLGCGGNKLAIEGVRGVDFYFDTDVKADLLGEWDFTPDGSVDFFYSSHLLEHVVDANAFMNKAWTKMRDGGLFLVTTPYGLNVRAWQDPTHVRPMFKETYFYWNKPSRKNMGVEHYSAYCDFDIVNFWPVWNRRYATRAENNHDLAEKYFETFNAVDDLTCLLKARKNRDLDKSGD